MKSHLTNNTILYKMSIPSELLNDLPYLNFPKFIPISSFTPRSFKTLSFCSSLTVYCPVLKFQFEHIFTLYHCPTDDELSKVGMTTCTIDGFSSSNNIFNLKILDYSLWMLWIFWIVVDEKGFPNVIWHFVC